MNNDLIQIERLGIRRQFPSIKTYLKSFVLGPVNWQIEDLPRLQRYANQENFEIKYGEEAVNYRFYNAKEDLRRVSIALQWHAIQMALKGDDFWQDNWIRGTSYGYWAQRMDCCNQKRIYDDFQTGKRRQYLGFLELHQIGLTIGTCLSLGWKDEVIDLARRVYECLSISGFIDGDDSSHRRTHHFILRLVSDWQGWPVPSLPSCAFDEPLFNALIAYWKTSDMDVLSHLLLAACDRHTHQARFDSNKACFDFPWDDSWYIPFEVLSVMRLRQIMGLVNPDLDHPLMKTPLGKLQEPVPLYEDDLIKGVLTRARMEYPDL
jgi:hypothetical protein